LSGSLSHAPPYIIQQLIIDLGHGTLVADGLAWPVLAYSMTDSPERAICVYGTTGQKDGRFMTSGEVQEHYGIQVAVRSMVELVADAKCRDIAIAFDEDVNYTSVTLDSSVYSVREITRISGPIPGKELPETKRSLFTLNVITAIRQIV